MAGKILIVDDSRMLRLSLGTALRTLGHEVVEAEHGDEALKRLGEHKDICLVISDITMPWKDGLELLQEIKASAEYNKIPVLMLTAEGNPEEIKKAIQLGCRGWMIKPFKEETLKNTLKSLLA